MLDTVPSGSMRPTILEGDVILVNRIAYDLKLPLTDISLAKLGEPKRGEVLTFTSPADGVRLIKRLVALPGDAVEMQDEVLFVNGVAAEYGDRKPVTEPLEGGGATTGLRTTEKIAGKEHAIQFLPERPAARSFGPYVVPKDHYFFLGDGRPDLRYIGPVPRRLLIGHANRIVVSADILGNWMPRFGRTGERIQ